MNKLWFRLTAAIVLVALTAIALAAVWGSYQVSNQFRRFVADNQTIELNLEPALVEYYSQHGSWAGVENVFLSQTGPGMMGRGRGMRLGMPRFTLTDAAGRVVYDETGNSATQLPPQVLANATPLQWQGQTIGFLLVAPPPPGQMMMTQPAQNFLSQTPRLLFQGGVVAGVLAVLVGLFIARGLSAPLSQLAAAAGRIAHGHFNQRVPVKGPEEVANLAVAFNDMAANLQQAETLRRNLVADVAHELRTPLSVIQGNLQAILDDVYPLDKAEIAAIYDETLILNRLISDLRELAQAEAGQLDLNLQPTDLSSLVTTAADLFGELAREKQVNLTLKLPPDLPPVQADSDRVRQVLHNLLTNALRHTPEGGQIEIEAQLSDHQARIIVADTGSGITAADLPHVFDRFWRADKSRSREHGGSGLGLAIARQLIEAHGGQIGVESGGVGRGSRFWFTLHSQVQP